MDHLTDQNKHLTRREWLRWMAAAGAGAALAACAPAQAGEPPTAPQSTAGAVQPAAPTAGQGSPTAAPASPSSQQPASPAAPAGAAYLAAVRGEDPAAATEAAIQALGGIESFVKNGSTVIIKPNICVDYHTYEYAATTNPQVVAALVRLALGAGAKSVQVMDFPFGGSAESAYAKSGIAEAVAAAGGEMVVMNRNKFKKTRIPDGKSIKEWEIYQEALTCDVFINVPIAKHHNMARLTLGGKNLLGVIQNRGGIHAEMGQRIADLISVVRPDLTVVDCVRTLMDHGPTGGSLDDVQLNNTVVASRDIVAADAYATRFFDLTGPDIPFIKAAAEMGHGTLDLSAVKVEEISL